MYIGSLKATSTRATWVELFEIKDDETDELLDLSDVTIVVQFRDPGSCRPTLTADIAIVDTGVFQASLTLSQIRTLCPQTYEVGITLERDDETTQEFIGTIPVLDGIVS